MLFYVDFSTGNEEAIYGSNSSIYIEVTKDEVNSGNLTLNVGESHGIKADLENKEYQISLLADGDISINVIGDNKDETGDGINVSNNNLGSINITAGHNNIINAKSAHGDGIKVESGEWNDADAIKLTAMTGNNEIKSGNNGIDHGGSQQILLQADKGINKITTVAKESDSEHKEITGDGIRIGTDKDNSNSSPSGKVILEALSNIINAEDAGLNNSGSSQAIIDISASLGPNIISGDKEAVLLNGSGTITVTAENPNPDISLLVEVGEGDAEDFNNFLTGGSYGVHAGQDSNGIFNAIADNNNYVSGGEYGIWTEASSGQGATINLDAEHDNIIGFTGTFYDDDGDKFEGEIGKTGIMVESGTINLTAGNANIITTTENGIIATGDNSKVVVDGKINQIFVNDESGKNGVGIKVNNGADIIFTSKQDGIVNSETQITVSSSNGEAIGLYADGGSSILTEDNINLGKLNIDVANLSGRNVYGAVAKDGTEDNHTQIKLNVLNDIEINVSTLTNNTTAHASGLEVGKYGNIELNSRNGNISVITKYNDSSLDNKGTLYGIYAKEGVIALSSSKDISISSGSEERLFGNNYGIYSDAGLINITSNNVYINSYSYSSDEAINGGMYILAGGKTYVNAKGDFIVNSKSSENNSNRNYGIYSYEEGSLFDASITGNVRVTSEGYNSYAIAANANGGSYDDGDFKISSGGYLYVSAKGYGGIATSVYTNNSINKLISDKNLYLYGTNKGGSTYGVSAIGITHKSITHLSGQNVFISSENTNGKAYGLWAEYSYDAASDPDGEHIDDVNLVNITSGNNLYLIASANNGTAYGAYIENSVVKAEAQGSSFIVQQSKNFGYGLQNISKGDFSLTSQIDNFVFVNNVYSNAISIEDNSKTYLEAKTGNNTIESVNGMTVMASSGAKFSAIAENGYNYIQSSGNGMAVYSNQSEVNLRANYNQISSAGNMAIYSRDSSNVDLIARDINYIRGGAVYSEEGNSFANKYAVYSLGGSSVILNAGNQNALFGAVYAEGNGTTVTLSGLNGAESKSNVIRSYAIISNAGDLSSDTTGIFEKKSVVSALYAEQGANITLNGMFNDIGTYADYTDDYTLERTVWAYNGYADDFVGERVGSQINITGQVNIKTDSYDKSPKSLDVAIAAGTGVNLDKTKVSKYIKDKERAKVDINYSNVSSGWSENGMTYNVEGDILSAYEGLINIDTEDADAGINIHGNLLAGNNGILNVNLGKNGVLTGRADDYGDAGFTSDEGHSSDESFSDPAFSSAIYKGGEVNLKMGEGSRWNVKGQSWITRIKASDDAVSETSPLIDLVSANSDRNTNAQALTVYELKGNVAFNMNLDGNRDVSDMLYIKNAQGEYTINVKDAVTVADMYANEHTGLRFATLGAGSHASFRAITWDGGVNNVEYEVDTDDYDTSTENTAYNGASLTDGKPGDDTVDTFFGSDGEPGSTTPAENEDENIETQNLAANVKLAKAVVENVENETAVASDTLNTDATNYKLVAVKSSETSDIGKSVIDMSRANYANAVYMDTLNKRQGEARFVGDTDHGVWVRLRHDNIGKDDSFRTHNTMVEVGFEQRDVNDYGEFHTGFALDYMNGQIDYHTVDGDGDIERYGVWFYTTYLGNDGQYADLVLKYGHLKNDFGFNTKTQGEHVTGDYTNEVASISAEYGWKFSNSYNYYIEPQVQLQYSYVTGADYTTSQGSKVDLDSIHSLIGRVGFRAGKDFNTETPITAYIRGDVLHEFLGDQDIYAYDNTGVMDVTYENDDTWYSAGVGLSVQSSENTYFFIEGEQVFGADNDSTYTVSGGFKHSF